MFCSGIAGSMSIAVGSILGWKHCAGRNDLDFGNVPSRSNAACHRSTCNLVPVDKRLRTISRLDRQNLSSWISQSRLDRPVGR